MAKNNRKNQWHLSWGGQTYGPFDQETIKKKVASGELDLNASYAWRPGCEDWKPCLEVEELTSLLDVASPPPPPPPPPIASGKDNEIAPGSSSLPPDIEIRPDKSKDATVKIQPVLMPKMKLFPETEKEGREWKDSAQELWVASMEPGLFPAGLKKVFHCGLLLVEGQFVKKHEFCKQYSLDDGDEVEECTTYEQEYSAYKFLGIRGNTILPDSETTSLDKAHVMMEAVAYTLMGEMAALKDKMHKADNGRPEGFWKAKPFHCGRSIASGISYSQKIQVVMRPLGQPIKETCRILGPSNERGRIISLKEFRPIPVQDDDKYIRITNIYSFSECLARADVEYLRPLKAGSGFLNRQGNWAILPKFYRAGSFNEGLAGAKLEEECKWGFIDRSGNWAVEPSFEETKPFVEGLAPVKAEEGGKWGYIDRRGEWAIKPFFDDAFVFQQGRARIILKGECGFIDMDGGIVVDPIFSPGSTGYSQGLAAVSYQNMWGYLDRNGEWAVRPIFSEANPFSEGLAVVRLDGKSGWIRNPLVPEGSREWREVGPIAARLAAFVDGWPGKRGFFPAGKLEHWHIDLVRSAFGIEWDRILLAFSGDPEEPFESGIAFTDRYVCTKGHKGNTRMEYAEWSRDRMDKVRSMAAMTAEDKDGSFREGEFWRLFLAMLELWQSQAECAK